MVPPIIQARNLILWQLRLAATQGWKIANKSTILAAVLPGYVAAWARFLNQPKVMAILGTRFGVYARSAGNNFAAQITKNHLNGGSATGSIAQADQTSLTNYVNASKPAAVSGIAPLIIASATETADAVRANEAAYMVELDGAYDQIVTG